MKTNITCTRCGTVTTWTPYCPGCGAYLEFAGDPPWMPEPQIPDDDAEGAGYEAGPLDPTTGATTAATDTPPSAGATTAAADATATDATKVATTATDAAATATATAAAAEAEAAAPDATSETAATDATAPEATEGGRRKRHARADSTPKPTHPHRRFGGEDPWWRFWDRADKHPAAPPPPTPEPTEIAGPHEGDAPDPFTYVVVAPEVPATVSAESPARQEEAPKRTIPIGRPDDLGVPGGIPCPHCRFRNYVDASYCARCGYPLRSAVPEAWTPANVLAPSEKPPRRTDWSFLVLVGIGVFILGVILFAPPGEPVRAGIGNVIRSFAYWLDPDLGTPATIASVDASSTGYGNPATAVVGDDARYFWASEPSKEWGAGTSLTFKLSSPATIDRMVIKPGIQNGQFAVRALATPENLTLIFVELDSETPEPSASPSGSGSGTASGTATPSPSSGTDSASPSSTKSASSPSSTKSASSPSSTTSSSSPSGSASESPTGSASPTPKPTPTATPSVQASLPMIVEPTDWTTVVNFPAVYTDKVTLRIESVFPPALPDTYATNGNGQVAISGIQFLQKWDLTSLFNFSFREQATTVPTPSPSVSSGSPSPSGSPTPSGSASGSPSGSASGKSASPSPSGSKS